MKNNKNKEEGWVDVILVTWVIVSKKVNCKKETKDEYNDFDSARADFLYLTQEHPEQYDYVVLGEIAYNPKDIEIIDKWESDDYFKSIQKRNKKGIEK